MTDDTTAPTPRRRRRDERGAVALELAVVLPILVMLVFGIAEFGRAYHTKLAITHAAREGARLAAVDDPGAAAAAAAQAPSGSTVSVSGCGGGQASVTVTKNITIQIPLVDIDFVDHPISATAAMTCR